MFQKWKINFFLLFSEAPSFLKTEVISPIWTMYNANLNPIFKYMQFTELLQRFGPIKIMVLSSDQFSHSAMSSSLQLHEFTQAYVHSVGDAIQPSPVQFFASPQPVANQAPLSMGFSRPEYWSGLPYSSPWDFPNPGIEPSSPMFLPALAGGFFTTNTTRAAQT